MTATVTAPITTHGPGRSIALHLAPGLAALVVYAAAVPVAAGFGLPTIAALAVSGLVGVPAVQLAVLAGQRRRHPGHRSTRRPLPKVLGWSLAEIALAAAAFALTASWGSRLRETFFGWWPAAWALNGGSYSGFGRPALWVTAVLMLLGSVVVAPVVEEYYFRGYLLPRMPARLGAAAPLAHTVLFACYHLWTPWLAPTRILAILPLAYVAAHTRDIRIGIFTHVVLNATDLALLLVYLVGSR